MTYMQLEEAINIIILVVGVFAIIILVSCFFDKGGDDE